jgi:hypothetical protein
MALLASMGCLQAIAISNIRNSNSSPNLKRLHWMSWLVPPAFHSLHYYGSSFCGPVAEYMPTSPVLALTGQRLQGHAFVFRVYRSTYFFNTPHWMEVTKEWLSPLLNSFTQIKNVRFFFFWNLIFEICYSMCESIWMRKITNFGELRASISETESKIYFVFKI